ncbi:MAG: glycosyltransferase family 4 protein [Cyclobacteriaceae bacterium]|nr:glycosyltransferase family 4 protein [Cyclobacteriaceae bacterium]
MKVLFLIPYPLDNAPSQRFRFEQYFGMLADNETKHNTQVFLSQRDWTQLYQPGKNGLKIWMLLKGFLKRSLLLFKIPFYDFIFIHREAAPVGPPVFEWLIAKVFRKKIIYDFDDAIWLTDKKNENALERFIRFRSKVGLICNWSYKVSCGNEYLCNYTKQFTKNVVLNPTTIDTEFLHNPEKFHKKPSDKITIGWTGSHSTLKYLKQIELVLSDLEQKYPQLQFLVIADKAPDLNLQRLVFIPWSKETEAGDLAQIDIGIMPLPDDDWSKGKCGFKALQYMAMEIPCVVSPVGVNTKIIEHGVNGYHATTAEEWIQYLEALIHDAALRKKMGEEGRKKVIDQYSVLSNTSTFLSLFS